MMKLVRLVVDIVRYNLKIIFANKFIYFMLAGVAFYLLISLVLLFDAEAFPEAEEVYFALLMPGILLIFYPTAFGIQNDSDSRMLEMLFGIPDYRYKVWLVRLLIIIGVVFVMLLVLAWASVYLIVPVDVIEMTGHVIFPVMFLGCLSFFISTLVRNGNGTAAVMVAIGMGFWISITFIEHSQWNIFLNPYDFPRDALITVWEDTVLYNRIFLAAMSLLAVLGGLLRLQKREKFVS